MALIITPIQPNPIIYNFDTVTSNITIATDVNGVSAGPITVNNGVTVTVPDGQTWVVV